MLSLSAQPGFRQQESKWRCHRDREKYFFYPRVVIVEVDGNACKKGASCSSYSYNDREITRESSAERLKEIVEIREKKGYRDENATMRQNSAQNDAKMQ